MNKGTGVLLRYHDLHLLYLEKKKKKEKNIQQYDILPEKREFLCERGEGFHDFEVSIS